MTKGHFNLYLHAALFAIGQYVVTHTPQIMALVPESIKPLITPILSIVAVLYYYTKQSPLKGA